MIVFTAQNYNEVLNLQNKTQKNLQKKIIWVRKQPENAKRSLVNASGQGLWCGL